MLLLADGGHGNPQKRAFNENEINRAINRSRPECLSQLRNLFDLTADQ